MFMLILSHTLPLMLRLIFSSKSKPKVLRLRCGSVGLSMLFWLKPNFSSAVPCVRICTPPGPKIFSAGPRSKCMSEKSNFSFLPSFSNSSSFRARK